MGAALSDSCVLGGRDRGGDGMREEAALCGHILPDGGRFHEAPNSCCWRLHASDRLLARAARQGPTCRISQRFVSRIRSEGVGISVLAGGNGSFVGGGDRPEGIAHSF